MSTININDEETTILAAFNATIEGALQAFPNIESKDMEMLMIKLQEAVHWAATTLMNERARKSQVQYSEPLA